MSIADSTFGRMAQCRLGTAVKMFLVVGRELGRTISCAHMRLHHCFIAELAAEAE